MHLPKSGSGAPFGTTSSHIAPQGIRSGCHTCHTHAKGASLPPATLTLHAVHGDWQIVNAMTVLYKSGSVQLARVSCKAA